MAKSLSDEDLRQALRAEKTHNTTASAAASLGLPTTTYQARLRVAKSRTLTEDRPELPTFPDDDVDAEEILDSMSNRFAQRLRHEQARKWFEIKMPNDEPCALVVVGDPHIGSNGCNVPLLRRDVEIMANTPNVYAMNIGDTVDNWGGRLIRAYADNDVSRQTERRLARWFLQDANVPWLVWTLGNHDTMDGEFATYLKTLNAEKIVMVDWQAEFKLVFPNQREIKINAAHNHKGTSIYNKLHGQKRAALWGADADIYVAGHHHECAITQEETDDNRWITLARARGYKYIDDWATMHGFPVGNVGASIMFVIDPDATSAAGLIIPFADISVGAKYLTSVR